MATTYLELTNRVLRLLNEVEIDQTDFATVRGIQAAAKTAVLDVVRDINTQKFEWPFNSATGTQILTPGTNEYTWPANLRSAEWGSFYIEKDTNLNINTKPLKYVTRDEWYKATRPQDYDSSPDGRNVPEWVFESTNGGFGVTPNPNEAYTVKFTYYINAISLSAATDQCTIPSEYDYIITDGALARMYMFLDNDERARVSESTYKKGLDTMSFVLIPKDHYFWDGRVHHTPYSTRKMWTGY